jgi:outer membrane protein assembly factor BamB
MSYGHLFRVLVIFTVFLIVSQQVSAQAPEYPDNRDEWSGWGANYYNNRWASDNQVINSTTISNVTQHCKLEYPTGVSATPVIQNTTAFYPTWNGSFVALDYTSCKIVWEIDVKAIILQFGALSDLQVNATNPVSRTSPQIDGNVLYFGTQSHALLVAVDLATGATLGTFQINPHPLAIITVSPTVYKGTIFVGTSSQEEVGAEYPGYECCSFIGNFMALTFDRKSGKFTSKWTFEALPANQGWAGAGIWGSQPPIDPVGNQVFIATGNLYIYPQAYQHCENQTSSCMPDGIWQESVLGLDINTGKVNWGNRVSALDGFTMVCWTADASPLCNTGPNTDADFAMFPTYVPASLSGLKDDMVVVGQKSGNIYAFAAKDGSLVWGSKTSPSSSWGGLSWGMAVDNARVYFTAINYGKYDWPLIPSGVTITNSAFGSANLSNGNIIWETQVPQNNLAYTPPTVVGDIIIVARAGLGTAVGSLMALSKTTGSILFDWPTDSTMRGGITVQDQYLIFGTGYDYSSGPFTSGSLYVLTGPIAPPTKVDTQGIEGTPSTTTIIPATSSKAPKKNSAGQSIPLHTSYLHLVLPVGILLFGKIGML